MTRAWGQGWQLLLLIICIVSIVCLVVHDKSALNKVEAIWPGLVRVLYELLHCRKEIEWQSDRRNEVEWSTIATLYCKWQMINVSEAQEQG